MFNIASKLGCFVTKTNNFSCNSLAELIIGSRKKRGMGQLEERDYFVDKGPKTSTVFELFVLPDQYY